MSQAAKPVIIPPCPSSPRPTPAALREMLADLPTPVRLVFFTQTLSCETCEPTKQILGELAELSGQITVEEHNLLLEKELAEGYGVDRVPSIAVVARRTTGSASSGSRRVMNSCRCSTRSKSCRRAIPV